MEALFDQSSSTPTNHSEMRIDEVICLLKKNTIDEIVYADKKERV